MHKTVKGVLAVLVIAGAGYAAYYFWNKSKAVSKQDMVAYLAGNNFTDGSTLQLMAFGDDYIKAWYTAAKAGQGTFILSGKSYNTNGGTAVK